MYIYLVLAVTLFSPLTIFAQNGRDGWCGSIFKSVEVGCSDRARTNGIGGSYPILFDAFNVNSAAIPTYKTPLGVEAFTHEGKFNFALIKGLGRIGAGATSSSTTRTFYSPVSNYDIAMSEAVEDNILSEDYEVQGLRSRYHNFGTAMHLFGNQNSIIQASVGASSKYFIDEGKWRNEAGAVLKTNWINIGYSYSKSQSSENISAWNFGMKVWKMFIEYTYFENRKDVKITTKITSINYTSGGFQLTYGIRKQSNPQVTLDIQDALAQSGINYRDTNDSLGIAYRWKSKFLVGLFEDYIISEGTSLVFQYLF